MGADVGKKIITIAYEDKIIKSRSGILYKPESLVKDLLNEDVDGLIICGGWYGDTRQELIRENFLEKRVVRDRNIITAQGIAFVDFAIEICDWFNLFENQKEKESFVKSIKGF